MKAYVEAYWPDGRQILGTGSGQNVIRHKVPIRSVAWRRIVAQSEPEPWKGATIWRLVDERGRLLASHTVARGGVQRERA